MALTPVSIGGALVWIVGGILVQIRGSYLERMSRRIKVDESSHFRLVHAKWAYSVAVLAFLVGSSIAFLVIRDRAQFLLGGTISMAMIGYGIWEFKNLRRASLTIGDGKVIYTDGVEVREVVAKDVISVSIYWSWFRVALPNLENQAEPLRGSQESKDRHEEYNAFQKWLLSKKQSMSDALCKQSYRTVLIPATLEKSEVTLAFLRQAAAKNTRTRS